jgi:RNA polymerase sigma-70 factor (ECF subfamily)
VRRRGFRLADADDLTQDFLLRVVQGGILERADRNRGRFRSFLLACLDHHLAHARERVQAQKRGGGQIVEPVGEPIAPDADPLVGFDRDWADILLARVHDHLRLHHDRYEALASFLMHNGDADSYAAAGRELGLSEGAVKVAVHRLRTAFRECLRSEVAETLADPTPAAIDAELTDLLAVLRKSP